MGMSRRETQRLAAIHDILAQAHGQFTHAVLWPLGTNRIVVQRAGNAAKRRVIPPLAVHLANYLLQNHRHFLLVDNVARGRHVTLAGGKEHRRVDTLHRTRQRVHRGVAVAQARHHIGGIDAGKRLIVTILEQAARAHGNRPVHHVVDCVEVIAHRIRQLCRLERRQNLLVRSIAQRQRIEVVLLHKLVEHIGAEHHSVGNGDCDAVKVVTLRVTLDNRVDKRQAAPFTAQTALADAREIAVFVKTVGAEVGHQTAVFHQAIFHNQVAEQPLDGRRLADVDKTVHLDHLGDGEDGA